MKKGYFVLAMMIAAASQAQFSAEKVATEFMASLNTADSENVIALLPTIDVMKRIAPDEVGNKTDDELSKEMSKVHEFMANKVSQIISEAEENDLYPALLKFSDVSTKKLEVEGKDKNIYQLKIDYTYRDQSDQIMLIGVMVDDGYFLLDIPQTYGVFDNLETP